MQAFKVKLHHAQSNTTVYFDAAPDISESGSVNYRTIDPIHSPGGINAYTNTVSRTFNLSGTKLFSRNQAEATHNYNRLQMLKGWRYPTFGTSMDDPFFGPGTLGAPPAVLEFSAYALPSSNGNTKANGLIHRVPVVISNLNISYPTDCDYIPTVHFENNPELDHIPSGIPFPTIMTIDITLLESHTPKQYMQFSLNDMKRGKMVGF